LDWMEWGFLVVTVIVAFFIIWTLVRISRMIRKLETFLKSLEEEIIPLVRNLRGTSENINRLVDQSQERLNQLEGLFQTLKESAQIFSVINRIMRGGVTSTLLNLAGLTAGFKSAGQTLFKRKRKGGS
jgi:predicted PurR-regulated permease PerM